MHPTQLCTTNQHRILNANTGYSIYSQAPSTTSKWVAKVCGPIEAQSGTKNNCPVLDSTSLHWETKFVPSNVETMGFPLTLNCAELSLWALINCATFETSHVPQQSYQLIYISMAQKSQARLKCFTMSNEMNNLKLFASAAW